MRTYFSLLGRFLLSQSKKRAEEDNILPLEEEEEEEDRDVVKGAPLPRPDPMESSNMVHAFIIEHN